MDVLTEKESSLSVPAAEYIYCTTFKHYKDDPEEFTLGILEENIA